MMCCGDWDPMLQVQMDNLSDFLKNEQPHPGLNKAIDSEFLA
jgi:hypothetical protein